MNLDMKYNLPQQTSRMLWWKRKIVRKIWFPVHQLLQLWDTWITEKHRYWITFVKPTLSQENPEELLNISGHTELLWKTDKKSLFWILPDTKPLRQCVHVEHN